MSKIAILGDTHFGASKSSNIIHDHFEEFYKFFFEYLEKNDIKTIIQEGDLYDIRREVQFNTLYRSKQYFFDQLTSRDILMLVISGNHDCLFKNTNKINSVRMLETDNMEVIDTIPMTRKVEGIYIDFFPWINSENYDLTMEFIKNSTSKYAVGHFEFVNFPMHPGTMADNGMDHKIFAKYDTVFSGHYHTISQKDNILYTGTPCQLNWSDWHDPKGFWVLDTETGTKEHIENPYTLFEKILYTDDLVYDVSNVTKKYVKIQVVSKSDQKKFDLFVDAVNQRGPYDVKILENSTTESVEQTVHNIEFATTQSMIGDVVDSMTTDLDRPKLKKAVFEMYSEALSIVNSL